MAAIRAAYEPIGRRLGVLSDSVVEFHIRRSLIAALGPLALLHSSYAWHILIIGIWHGAVDLVSTMSDLDNELSPDNMSTIRPSGRNDKYYYGVRPDKAEPAFRRYEPYIQRALLGAYTISPQTELGLGVSGKTFCARFRDAILGFLECGYTSSIPRTDAVKTQLTNTVARMLTDGRVRVFDKRREAGAANRGAVLYSVKQLDRAKELFGLLFTQGIDVVSVVLPDGPFEAKERAINELEHHIREWYPDGRLSGRMSAEGRNMVYCRLEET